MSRGPSPDELGEAWNRSGAPLPRVRLPIRGPRQKHAKARLHDVPDIGVWERAIRRIAASRFCRGDNNRHWVADFEFLIRPGTLTKIEEGKYDDRDKPLSKSKQIHGIGPDGYTEAEHAAARSIGWTLPPKNS